MDENVKVHKTLQGYASLGSLHQGQQLARGQQTLQKLQRNFKPRSPSFDASIQTLKPIHKFVEGVPRHTDRHDTSLRKAFENAGPYLCEETDMYSPQAIDSAPPTSPATPARVIACRLSVPPPTPSIKLATLTSPSLAPRTPALQGTS
jgi:hypothetical protein